MTKNKRYEAHYDALTDARMQRAGSTPVTLPQQAYGPEEITWVKGERPPVWAWVNWPDRPAERIAAFATGWNDRIVVVNWYTSHGAVSAVVWRNAVRRRRSALPGGASAAN